MLRTLFSVVVALLLAAIAALLYVNTTHSSQNSGKDVTESGTPPEPPVAPRPVAPTPVPAPQPLPPPPEKKEVATPEPKPEPRRAKRTHVVQNGESLSTICKKYYGTSDYYPKLAEANSLHRTDHIRVGQVLVLPELPVVTPSDTEPEPQLTNTPVEPEEFEPQPPTLNTAKPRPDK